MTDREEERETIVTKSNVQAFTSKEKDAENECTPETILINSPFEVFSTKRGILNQILVTGSVLILAAACGMPIGYSAVLLPQLYNSSDELSMDIELGSWFASVHSLATPIGAFVSGPIADKLGRRPSLLVAIVPLIIGWSTIALATSHACLLAGRIVAGVAVGLIGAPAQILIAEIAIPRLRGLLIGVPFVSYSMGILLVYALGSGLHWREVAWCGIILPILSAVAIFLSPESPTWLARNGRNSEALKSLSWLRGDADSARNELSQLTDRLEHEQSMTKSSENFMHTFLKPSTLKPLVIINFFHFLQIFSGTYLVVFYAVDIISEYGAHINTMRAAVMTAIVRLIFIIIFCFLLLYTGRRAMVIWSGVGSGMSSMTLGIYTICRLGEPKTTTDIYFAGVCIFLYIACNTGFMTMPGIMIGELLPAKIRGQIAGYIFAAFNIALFIVAKVFPFIRQALRTHGLFMMFGISSFAASFLMYLLFPETKGKRLEEIEDYFANKNWLWINRPKKRFSKEQNDSA